MGASQSETVLLVQFRDVVHQPCSGCVAPRAIIAHRHRMHIGMAGNAVGRDRGVELHRTVAGTAIHLGMDPLQWKSSAIMVEAQRIAHHDPTIGNMACRTIDPEGIPMG